MRFIKEEKEDGNIYTLVESKDKKLRIFYGGTFDLYWSLNDNELDIEEDKSSSSTFIITKENFALFNEFKKLFNDIDNINLYDEDEYIPFEFDTVKEKEEYIENRRKEHEEEKRLYRERNHHHYNDLFDKEKRIITWVSDETCFITGNILKIKENSDSYVLEFSTQPFVDGYESDFKTATSIPIRFRNSGSTYYPFNRFFMNMYNNLKDIDDTYDYGHQIDVEEYLYNKDKVLRKHI